MKSVMLVDDSAFMRNLLKDILSKEFIIVTEAENGRDAIIKYKTHKPNIVILDITMPILNGIEALKEILIYDPSSNIVMNSSLGQKFFILESIRLGAKDFIIKPYFENLIPILNKLHTAKKVV
jgi:two-component system chemotaxis response regulator CheY